jgi:hypothetical protein
MSLGFSPCILPSESEANASAERGAGTCAVHSPGRHTNRDHVEGRGKASGRGCRSEVQFLLDLLYYVYNISECGT